MHLPLPLYPRASLTHSKSPNLAHSKSANPGHSPCLSRHPNRHESCNMGLPVCTETPARFPRTAGSLYLPHPRIASSLLAVWQAWLSAFPGRVMRVRIMEEVLHVLPLYLGMDNGTVCSGWYLDIDFASDFSLGSSCCRFLYWAIDRLHRPMVKEALASLYCISRICSLLVFIASNGALSIIFYLTGRPIPYTESKVSPVS